MQRAAPRSRDISVLGRVSAEFAEILTEEALDFIAALHRRFDPQRRDLLARRAARQKEFDRGELPDFLPDTQKTREQEWRVAPQPKDLLDRRVELTGPTDRKMVINALNSGASTFMADFEDANCPTWHNMVDGQINLRDAVRRTITFEQSGKRYHLKDKTAVMIPRPRGWHLDEKHLHVGGKAVSGALFDFGLFFFHNAKELIARGSGPYFYLPKMESHLEARLWNDIFIASQDQLGVKRGSIKATALIETCHRRGAPAMGGMAAQIPIKNDPQANEAALEKVRQDKLREVTDGCDGTWVAHPGLVPVAKEIFDQHMPQPNQYDRQRPDVRVTARDLLDFQPEKPITEAGLRNNISVGIQYLGAWLAGNGCVPVFNLMEDAATAEISRSQIWQWIRSPKGVLDDGRKVTAVLFKQLLAEELPKVKAYLGEAAYNAGRYEEGAKLFEKLTTGDYVEFLTLPAYALID